MRRRQPEQRIVGWARRAFFRRFGVHARPHGRGGELAPFYLNRFCASISGTPAGLGLPSGPARVVVEVDVSAVKARVRPPAIVKADVKRLHSCVSEASFLERQYRAVSSAVEHTLHTRGVIGSIPIPPTTFNPRNQFFSSSSDVYLIGNDRSAFSISLVGSSPGQVSQKKRPTLCGGLGEFSGQKSVNCLNPSQQLPAGSRVPFHDLSDS